MNGPVSVVPTNFLWFRSATLDVYRSPPVSRLPAPALTVERKDPALDGVVPPGVRPEALATGFGFTEGPVWSPDGDLLFSDPNENTIYRWNRDGQVSIFRTKSGYAGVDISEYKQPGSNGLTFDPQGRLTVCQHGERRVIRIEPTGAITVLADRYQGKRLNSPNDLVYRKDGTLYFTDPPFGLPKVFDDPRKELAFSGVYRVKDGQVTLVAKDLTGPNGIAFSPDEKFLYVTNWDEKKKVVMRYPVNADGTLGTGSVFFDMTSAPGEEALDGMKVDAEGHLFVSGPGGVWVISGEGKHLGTLRFPELPANMAWGDADGRTLYLTARTSVYRLQARRPGHPPGAAGPDAVSTDVQVGVGLRPPHYAGVLEDPPAARRLRGHLGELPRPAHGGGGRPLETLERVRALRPIRLHGVSMNLGSVDPLSETYLARLRTLADRLEPECVSDHVCWTGEGGENLHDLLPLPWTEEALEHLDGARPPRAGAAWPTAGAREPLELRRLPPLDDDRSGSSSASSPGGRAPDCSST